MPKVPNQNELEIAARGLPGVAFTPVEARTHNISQAPNLQQQARMRGFGNGGAHLGTGGVRKAELNDTDAAYQAAKQAGALQQQIGQGISNLGLAIQDIALKERAKADDARIQDAKNQFLRAQLDQEYEEGGWRARKGAAAMPSGDNHRPLDDEYDDRLNDSYQQISQSLGNERQREMFREWADGERLQQRAKIRAHAMREFADYRENTYRARKELAGETVLRGDIERGIAMLQENNSRYADENGLPPEWLEAANRQGVSREITATVGQMIEGGDLAGANAMLEKYRGHISGEDMAKTAATLKTAQEIRQATDDAEASIRAGNISFDDARPGDPYAIYNQGYNDARYRKAAFGHESGGNNHAYNKDTGATGKGQFLASTWISFGKSAVGRQLRGNMSKSEWLEQRKNPAVMDAAMDWYRDTARAYLQQHGVPWNDTTAYLAHFAGATGAVAIYQADPNGSVRDTVRKLKNGAQMIAKNPTIFSAERTNAGMMGWAAKSIGVKPDPNAPATGRPQQRQWQSDAQLSAEVQRLYPDNPVQQRAYTDRVRIARNVAVEQEQAAHAANVNAALDIVYRGGGIGDIPPSVLQDLNSEERHKLHSTRESVNNLGETTLKRENFDIYMRASRPENLAKMTEDQLLALRLDLGQDYTQSLIEKKRALEKAGKSAKEQYKMEDGLKKAVIRTAFGDLLDPYNTDKKNREYLSKVDVFLQRKIDDYAPALLAKQITEGEMMQLLINDLKTEFVLEAPEKLSFFGRGWYRLGIDKKGKVKPLEDVNVLPPEEQYGGGGGTTDSTGWSANW